MLQVLAHSDLPHELVLVTVHASKLADVRKHVLQTICKLEGVDVTQAELDVGVDNKLGKTKDLSTQVEGVSESRLLSLLGCQCLDGLQVHVVVKMELSRVSALRRLIGI